MTLHRKIKKKHIALYPFVMFVYVIDLVTIYAMFLDLWEAYVYFHPVGL
jgi:hypothetical protein